LIEGACGGRLTARHIPTSHYDLDLIAKLIRQDIGCIRLLCGRTRRRFLLTSLHDDDDNTLATTKRYTHRDRERERERERERCRSDEEYEKRMRGQQRVSMRSEFGAHSWPTVTAQEKKAPKLGRVISVSNVFQVVTHHSTTRLQ
jgi:hypothetical protein